ncbi:hypothetical protein FSJ45_023350, partial [Escherichia coli]|nr:hypothetical protein [Escherichia coli]
PWLQMTNMISYQGLVRTFLSAGAIHIEPIGIYSKKVKSLKDLPEGGKVIMRDAVSEEGRILSIFEKEGVIKLKPGVDKVTAR